MLSLAIRSKFLLNQWILKIVLNKSDELNYTFVLQYVLFVNHSLRNIKKILNSFYNVIFATFKYLLTTEQMPIDLAELYNNNRVIEHYLLFHYRYLFFLFFK